MWTSGNLSMRGGADLHENLLFIENVILGLFWSFWDLLDLKNGSGSKFYARKWYQDLWKPKFKTFRGNFVISWRLYMEQKMILYMESKEFSPPAPKSPLLNLFLR